MTQYFAIIYIASENLTLGLNSIRRHSHICGKKNILKAADLYILGKTLGKIVVFDQSHTQYQSHLSIFPHVRQTSALQIMLNVADSDLRHIIGRERHLDQFQA